jgi:simple sugar transport system ATP-binding protein
LDAPVVLKLDGITKRFGDTLANDSIGFALRRGEVIALLGENGAGKTTLMNILFGHYVADAGTIEVDGRPLPPGNPRAALEAGIGMVHQHFTLADNLTVLENILIGTRPLASLRGGRAEARARISDLSRRFGLEIDADARVGNLAVGECQRVEILKALYRDARVLILDEPTAVLTPQEIEALFRTLKLAVAEGLAIVFISHKLGEVMAVSGRVLVLRHGRLAGERTTAETDRQELARLMIGAEVAPPSVPQAPAGPALLSLAGVSTTGQPGLRAADLTLAGGRITGLAGVSGNGQAALAALVAGTTVPTAGRMELLDAAVGSNWSPRAALARGVARIPEDRHRTGSIGAMSLAENAILECYGQPPVSRNGWIDWRAAERMAEGIIRDYDVRGGGPGTRIGLLSGGNMQKLILGRALAPEPRVILANQPTRGLDVGAVGYVHARLLEARARGAAVLLISEDLDEIRALSDTIHVISDGRVSPAFVRGSMTAAELGAWMAGQGFERAA